MGRSLATRSAPRKQDSPPSQLQQRAAARARHGNESVAPQLQGGARTHGTGEIALVQMHLDMRNSN